MMPLTPQPNCGRTLCARLRVEESSATAIIASLLNTPSMSIHNSERLYYCWLSFFACLGDRERVSRNTENITYTEISTKRSKQRSARFSFWNTNHNNHGHRRDCNVSVTSPGSTKLSPITRTNTQSRSHAAMPPMIFRRNGAEVGTMSP